MNCRQLRDFTAAAQHIIEFEAFRCQACFFEILIETKADNEEDAFGRPEHTGKRTNRSYVVKRLQNLGLIEKG